MGITEIHLIGDNFRMEITELLPIREVSYARCSCVSLATLFHYSIFNFILSWTVHNALALSSSEVLGTWLWYLESRPMSPTWAIVLYGNVFFISPVLASIWLTLLSRPVPKHAPAIWTVIYFWFNWSNKLDKNNGIWNSSCRAVADYISPVSEIVEKEKKFIHIALKEIQRHVYMEKYKQRWIISIISHRISSTKWV